MFLVHGACSEGSGGAEGLYAPVCRGCDAGRWARRVVSLKGKLNRVSHLCLDTNSLILSFSKYRRTPRVSQAPFRGRRKRLLTRKTEAPVLLKLSALLGRQQGHVAGFRGPPPAPAWPASPLPPGPAHTRHCLWREHLLSLCLLSNSSLTVGCQLRGRFLLEALLETPSWVWPPSSGLPQPLGRPLSAHVSLGVLVCLRDCHPLSPGSPQGAEARTVWFTKVLPGRAW